MVGKMALSKSGHDKGSIYIIVGEEEKSVFLADGRLKLIEKPKRKSKKHIQIIKKLPDTIIGMLSEKDGFQNETIKRAIKLYSRSKIE